MRYRTRTASRGARRSRSRGSASSTRSYEERETPTIKRLRERLDEVERVNKKLEEKEKDKKHKFKKPGCEKQFKFNEKVQEVLCEKLRLELKKHFRRGVPDKIEELIKAGEKELDEQNHKLKVADEFGFHGLETFSKEELARDDKEEKKIKAMRKEKKEKEEKMRAKRGKEGGYRGFRERRFGDRREDGDKKTKDDPKCYNCQGFGHIARDCTKAKVGGRGRR